MRHDIVVQGVWLNTGDAGIDLWCRTCECLLTDDWEKELTVEKIAELVKSYAEHSHDTSR